MTREALDRYFMHIARDASRRSSCPARQAGAVLVNGGYVTVTGAASSLPGHVDCSTSGCTPSTSGGCTRTVVHAEMVVLGEAAKLGLISGGGTLYVTAELCFSCFVLCIFSGVQRIVTSCPLRDGRIFVAAPASGIALTYLPETV